MEISSRSLLLELRGDNANQLKCGMNTSILVEHARQCFSLNSVAPGFTQTRDPSLILAHTQPSSCACRVTPYAVQASGTVLLSLLFAE